MAKAKKTKNTKAESRNIRTGGIYFSNEINCQIKIDADAEEGKKLVSCVNLFDGQELGEGGIEPSGTIEIAENGKYDVKQYANANVNVPLPEMPICTLCTVEKSLSDTFTLTLRSNNYGNVHREYVERAISAGSYCYDIYMCDVSDYELDFSMDGTRRFQYYHENHGNRFYCVNNANGTDIQCKPTIPDTQEVHVSFGNDPEYPDTFYVEIQFINTTESIAGATFGSFEPSANHSYNGYMCFFED